MCTSLTCSIFRLTGFSQCIRLIWRGGWMHFASTAFWTPLWSSATLLKPESKFSFNIGLTFPFPRKYSTVPSYLGLWGCLVISHRCKGCTGCPSLNPQQQLLTSPDLLCHKQLPEWTCEPPTQLPCRPVSHQPSQFIRREGAVNRDEI